MKKSRYTEEQIIGILRQHEAGMKTADLCREPWDQRGDVIWLEVEVWRHGRQRGPAVESDGRREPRSEAAGGGAEPAR